jgi:putative ABC transport system permease protein
MIGSRVLCRYMAVFLNFDINSYTIPAWVYGLVIVVGIVAPLIAAALPVWRGTGISVREALSDYSVKGNAFGASGFDRAVARIGGTARPVLFAVRNSFRNRKRLVLTLATLCTAGLFFMTALNVRASMINTLDRLFQGRKYDLSLSFGTMVPYEKVEAALRATPGVRKAEGWIVTEASLPAPGDAPAAQIPPSGGAHSGGSAMAGLHGAGGAPSGSRVIVIGLAPQTELLQFNLSTGHGLDFNQIDEIVLNTAFAAQNREWRPGSTLSLRMGPGVTNWRIAGITREPFSPPMAYISRAYFEKMGGHVNVANSLRLALEKNDRDSISDVRTALDRNLEQQGLRALSSQTSVESRFGFDQHMLMIYVFLVVMSAVIGLVGTLGLMTTMSLNVLERRREMGVLRVVGASPRVIWLMVVIEASAVALMSWLSSAAIAWPVSRALGNFLSLSMFKSGLDFKFELRGLAVWFGVCLAAAAAASFMPAWHACRQEIREAIAYE